jgi:polysaccharide deacetylase 2 family uncharacterized protein YibQ
MSRKKKGRKKRGPSFYPSFIAFSGAAALFLGSLLYLAFLSGKSFQPPFEERSSPLSRQIAGIDQMIYTCLYRAKVPQKNIVFLEVQPKHRDRAEWDFTELLIREARQESVSAFERELKRMLSSRAPGLRFRTEKGPHGEAVLHVYSGAYYTHRVTIRADHRPPKGSPNQENASRVAIIIDDLGYDLDLAKSFMGLDLAVSLSVLPMAPFTKKIVEAAHEKNLEVMLHLPMEPETYPHEDAGPGALLTSMSEKEIKRLLEEHLKRVPGARGVNNHMGSRFTVSERNMGILMNELKRRGLYYVDSRTTSRTVALEVAQRLGVSSAKRNVFLDNELSREAMTFQWQRLLAISRQSGKAIGIAHPHPETVAFLKQSLPLVRREARLVRASEVVE